MVVVMIQKQDLIRLERFQVTHYILYDCNTYEWQPGETRYFQLGLKKAIKNTDALYMSKNIY